MSNILGILVITILTSLRHGHTQNVGLYSKRYENMDIDTILSSSRLVTNYVDCLLNRKPCPPEGKDLKRILPEALRTKCSRCWPSQKEGAIKVISKLYFDYPEHYRALRAKWDPTGEYNRRFEEYLRDQRFNVINNSGSTDFSDANGVQSQISVSTIAQNGTIPSGSSSNIRPVSAFPAQSRPTMPVRNATTSTQSFNINFTQRPTRQDSSNGDVAQDEFPAFIGTRFGDEENSDTPQISNARPAQIPQIPQSPSVRTTVFTTATTSTTTTTTPVPPTPTPTRFVYEPPTYVTSSIPDLNTRNPILNLINRLSMKVTNTAEFIAGMIRNSVKVITAHKLYLY